ncbi:MAG: N-acetylmuramoyl-L-alanine amidase, partial [Kiritimatiellae bacterium]|nr:N-acetylmuramoyl-L-alanine amidase [Kiritimatiellia bacterium]
MKRSMINHPGVAALMLCLALLPARGAPDFRSTTAPNGQQYVLLKNVARTYGLAYETPRKNVITLNSRWTDLEFTSGSRKLTANGLLIWLLEPVCTIRKRPAVDLEDAQLLIDPLLRPDEYLHQNGYRVVVLDPGHGGRDPGARSKSGREEKDIVLELAAQVRKILVNAGYRVYLTRENDRYLTLDERHTKARKWKADAFISIHMNS